MKMRHLAGLQARISGLVGGKIQGFQIEGSTIKMAIYSKGRTHYFIGSIKGPRPFFIPSEKPIQIKKSTKGPVNQFYRTHFHNRALIGVELVLKFGRVLVFNFEEDCSIELRLFPSGKNVSLSKADKVVFLSKPKDLEEVPTVELSIAPDYDFLEYGHFDSSTKGKKTVGEGGGVQDEIKKIDRALQKLEAEVLQKKSQCYRDVANWLLENQSNNVPEEFRSYIDEKRTPVENAEACFLKAKKNKVKLERSLQRKDELLNLKEKLLAGKVDSSIKPDQVNIESLHKKAGTQGRSLNLTSGAQFYVGKSAKDNLKLIRSGKPWYLWFHVKDQPGSHGVLRCNKGQRIPAEDMDKIGEFLLKSTFKGKSQLKEGLSFEILFTELRYVRPIPGDKLGRVTHRNSQTFRVRI